MKIPLCVCSRYELMKLSTMSANCWLTLRLLLIFSSMMEPYPNPRPMAKMMASRPVSDSSAAPDQNKSCPVVMVVPPSLVLA